MKSQRQQYPSFRVEDAHTHGEGFWVESYKAYPVRLQGVQKASVSSYRELIADNNPNRRNGIEPAWFDLFRSQEPFEIVHAFYTQLKAKYTNVDINLLKSECLLRLLVIWPSALNDFGFTNWKTLCPNNMCSLLCHAADHGAFYADKFDYALYWEVHRLINRDEILACREWFKRLVWRYDEPSRSGPWSMNIRKRNVSDLLDLEYTFQPWQIDHLEHVIMQTTPIPKGWACKGARKLCSVALARISDTDSPASLLPAVNEARTARWFRYMRFLESASKDANPNSRIINLWPAKLCLLMAGLTGGHLRTHITAPNETLIYRNGRLITRLAQNWSAIPKDLARFWAIAERLPPNLQEVLANRAYYSGADVVKKADIRLVWPWLYME